MEELSFNFKEEVIWDKNTTTSPYSKLGRTHETISILSKNGKIRKSHVPYIERRMLDVEAIKRDVRSLDLALRKTDVMKKIYNFLENNEYVLEPVKNKFTITGKKKGDLDRRVSVINSMISGFVEKDVIQVTREHYAFEHPTQKPVRLMERLINLVTDEGDTVLDPFSGSGSTALACQNLNRKFIAFEIDKEYFEIAQNRIEERKSQISLFDEVSE